MQALSELLAFSEFPLPPELPGLQSKEVLLALVGSELVVVSIFVGKIPVGVGVRVGFAVFFGVIVGSRVDVDVNDDSGEGFGVGLI